MCTSKTSVVLPCVHARIRNIIDRNFNARRRIHLSYIYIIPLYVYIYIYIRRNSEISYTDYSYENPRRKSRRAGIKPSLPGSSLHARGGPNAPYDSCCRREVLVPFSWGRGTSEGRRTSARFPGKSRNSALSRALFAGSKTDGRVVSP